MWQRMYIKPFSTELLRNERKKKQEITCKVRFLRGCFACPDKQLYEKHFITIDHKHDLFIFPFGKDHLFSHCDRYQ